MTRARFNATVLNVNPNSVIRGTRTEILAWAGFNVCEAASAADGLVTARDRQPDVVLVTSALPDMSGSEMCRRVKEDPATASIMVIESSDTCSPSDRADALETGADGVIAEPVDNDELIATINALVRIRWCRQQLCERVDELERELRAAASHG